MDFIAEENFVRKIAAHRLLFKHSLHVSTTLLVVSWLQLFHDMDFIWIDLNAKYDIMCFKVVNIPANHEELTHSDLRNAFTYNSDIFSGTSKTMMDRSFNICNHSSLFIYLHNFVNCLHSCLIM